MLREAENSWCSCSEGKCEELWLKPEFSGCICVPSCLRLLQRKCLDIMQTLKEEPKRIFYPVYLIL